MLNIVFSSCDGYSPLMTIALNSLLESNSKDFECINVYVLDNGIVEKNKEKIYSLCERYPCKVTFIKGNVLDSYDLDIVPMESNGIAPVSFASFSRLFLPTLIPDDVKKIIYLDSDGLVLGSLKDLWDTDISDYYCAGVIQTGIGETLKKEFWFFDVDNYVNSGFLYINLEKWRNDNVEEKFIEFLSNHQGEYFCSDQGVINMTLADKIKVLEPKYNMIGVYKDSNLRVLRKFKPVELEAYSEETILKSRENPIFVHFAGYETGPWADRNHKYFSEFEKYAKMCDCESIIQCNNQPEHSKPYKLYKKARGTVSDFVILCIPSSILIKRHNKIAIEIFRNEELKAGKDD